MAGWLYQHDRGSHRLHRRHREPSLLAAADAALVPDGKPGAGSSVVLVQVWEHDAEDWEDLPREKQELVIGRTKPDSIELDDEVMPPDSHVERTSLEIGGEELPIFRRNVAFGGVSHQGTVFVGFSGDQWRMEEMLPRMVGVGDGIRDALTRYSRPVSGAYYTVPSVDALARFAPPED